MRIDSSTVGMESARSYRASNTTARRFSIMDYRGGLAQGNRSLNAALGGQTDSAADAGQNGKKGEAKGAGGAAVMQEWQTRFRVSSSSVSIRSSSSQTAFQIREQTVRFLFEILFAARRGQLNRWMQENGVDAQGGAESLPGTDAGGSQASTQAANQDADANGSGMLYGEDGLPMMKPMKLNIGLKVLNYCQETYFAEEESVSFSTEGTVRTSDGREIRFQVNVGMSRGFQAYYRDELDIAAFTMCDPLVINLDTDAAQLEDQTFYFDIDGDGKLDEVSRLGAGSGYLALDKNGDGAINDGSELFGASSGNGFADLAKYDEDGNGWIDENDEIWSKLKIWAKDENGNDVLYRLADKGVGAICLKNVSTDFTRKSETGQTLGAIRNTGVFLYENGNVGTIQHVDVAKYDRGA